MRTPLLIAASRQIEEPAAAPPGGTIFASNTFTGTDGTNLADIGFTRHASYGALNIFVSDSNRARAAPGAATVVYYDPADPDSADYDVEGTIHFFTDISVQFAVTGRTQTAANTFYLFAAVAGPTDEWRLRKCVAGTLTTLDTAAQSWTADTDYTVKLEMRGTTLKGYVNGVEVCSAIDSDISLAGKAGLFAFGTSNNAAGIHFDDFVGRNAP